MTRNPSRTGICNTGRQAKLYSILRKTPRSWKISHGEIRCRLPFKGEFCPLEMLSSNPNYDMASPADIGMSLVGLTYDECNDIIHAADNYQMSPERNAIRKRLLKACGLSPRATNASGRKRKKK